MRTHSVRWIAVAAAAAVTFAAAGCDKQKSGTPLGAATKGALAYFPADATMAGGIKLAAVQNSALFKSMMPLASKMVGAGDVLGEAQAACGMNPLAAITELHFAVGPEPMVLAKGLDRAAAKKCASAIAAKHGRELAIKADGALDEMVGPRGSQWIQWIDDTTAFWSASKGVLQDRLAATSGLDGSAGFLDMAAKIDTGAELWFVSRDVKLPSGMPIKIDLDMQAVFLSVSLANGLTIKGGMRLASDAAAKEAVTRFNAYLDSMKSSIVGGLVGGVSFRQSGPDVLVQVKMDAKAFEQVVAMMPMAMGMMKSRLGGMMGGMAPPGPPTTPAPPAAPIAPAPGAPGSPPTPPPGGKAEEEADSPPPAPAGGKAAAGSAPGGSGTP